jgi:hypothetical protein
MSPSVDRSDAVTLGGVCGNSVLGSSFLAITFDCKTSHLPLKLSETDSECASGESVGEDHLSRSLSHVSDDIIMWSVVLFKRIAFGNATSFFVSMTPDSI